MKPLILYKYRQVNELSINALEQGKVWYSIPERLNDPNDVAITWEKDFTAKQIVREFIMNRDKGTPVEGKLKIDELVERYLREGYGYKKILEKIDELFMPVDKKTQRELLQDTLYYNQILFSKMGVFSLSEDPLNTLMWSHYSDSHKGFCLGFECHATNVLGQYANKIEYVEQINLPQIAAFSMNNNDDEIFLELAHKKSKDWSYEKEWRVIKPKGDSLYFYPGMLIEVILGLNAKIEDELKIREAVTKSGYNPIYKRVVKRDKNLQFMLEDC